jgi:hypothetical protein
MTVNVVTRTCKGTVRSLIAAALIVTPTLARAHCDGMDGPVVKAAQRALAVGNVNLVLLWVQPDDAAQIKAALQRTLKVRQQSAEASELADLHFFETLVRLHRAGEGAPYTGLRPVGRDLGPAIPAADKALETGDVEPVVKLLRERLEAGLRHHFKAAHGKQKYSPEDVEASHEFVKAHAAETPAQPALATPADP